mgnify:CR=1 FL=1
MSKQNVEERVLISDVQRMARSKGIWLNHHQVRQILRERGFEIRQYAGQQYVCLGDRILAEMLKEYE